MLVTSIPLFPIDTCPISSSCNRKIIEDSMTSSRSMPPEKRSEDGGLRSSTSFENDLEDDRRERDAIASDFPIAFGVFMGYRESGHHPRISPTRTGREVRYRRGSFLELCDRGKKRGSLRMRRHRGWQRRCRYAERERRGRGEGKRMREERWKVGVKLKNEIIAREPRVFCICNLFV
ncbi:hypothetical protein P5V15_013258 [Pogonomyrmex californicus]